MNLYKSLATICLVIKFIMHVTMVTIFLWLDVTLRQTEAINGDDPHLCGSQEHTEL